MVLHSWGFFKYLEVKCACNHSHNSDLVTVRTKVLFLACDILPDLMVLLPGASVRNSAHGKGHEEGGLAYAKA